MKKERNFKILYYSWMSMTLGMESTSAFFLINYNHRKTSNSENE